MPRWRDNRGNIGDNPRSRGVESPGRVRNRKSSADSPGEDVGDFGVTRHGLYVACLRIFPKRVLFAFSPQNAAVPPKMPEKPIELHPTTRSSCLASGGSARSDSSRLCSRIKAIASRRFARHSSRVFPCPLAPGTSAQYAMYHGPSCSTIAVNSLRILTVYRRSRKRGAVRKPLPTWQLQAAGTGSHSRFRRRIAQSSGHSKTCQSWRH